MGRIEELESQIQYHSELYYNDQPEISDAEFDALVDELRQLHPSSKVLTKVGAKPTAAWPEVKHTGIRMGSQLKVNSPQELLDWARKTGAKEFCWSEKLDGSSLALEFEGSQLKRALSRGDGTTGSDITPNVHKMKLSQGTTCAQRYWLRGEVIMKKSTFNEKYKGEFKNPRNAAAGFARRLDGEGCEDLGVVCYGVVGDLAFRTEGEKFKWLEDMGFFVPAWGVGSIDGICEVYQRYVDRDRDECPFEIDGLIVSVNDVSLLGNLGVVDNRPKGQRAFKFPAEEAETTIRAVTWQTGRTGRIAPVAELEPVTVGGVEISRVTLNNFGMIRELGLGLGSRILLRRANDVIPQVVRRITEGDADIAAPTQCPSCGDATVFEGAYLVCKNRHCPAQHSAHLLNFLRVLDVKGFGESTIDYLMAKGRLRTPSDFYALKPEYFQSEVMGEKLMAEFRSKSTPLTLPVFIDALGIPGVGDHAVSLAMQKFPTMGALCAARQDELEDIPGIGPTLANLLWRGLRDNASVIERLLHHIELAEPRAIQATGAKCKDWVCCFTGFRDESLEFFIQTQGGKVAASMNKQVTHLIAKDTSGDSKKLQKAREKGLTVLSKAELEAFDGV